LRRRIVNDRAAIAFSGEVSLSQLRRVAALLLAASLWAGAPDLAAADVNNGGFEQYTGGPITGDHLKDWDHTPYSLGVGTQAVFNLLDLSWQAQLSSRGADSGVSLSQNLGALVANTLYTVTFDASLGLLTSNRAPTATVSLGNLGAQSFYSLLSSTLTTISLTFTTGALVSGNALLSFVFDPVTSGGNYLVARSLYIDNVSVTATPVPGPVAGAGLMSLALAGAGWLARRRLLPMA
jgi:hypothetical protein